MGNVAQRHGRYFQKSRQCLYHAAFSSDAVHLCTEGGEGNPCGGLIGLCKQAEDAEYQAGKQPVPLLQT